MYSYILNNNSESPVFYLKVNKETPDFRRYFEKWIKIVSLMNGNYYILCDNPKIQDYISNSPLIDDKKILQSNRTLYSDVVYKMFANKWFNTAFAHLTVLEHSKMQNIKWFWNIDADDTNILLNAEHCAKLLNKVQIYASKDYKDAYSLDMWRSRTNKVHWSFGITYMRNNIDWLGLFEKNYDKKNWLSTNRDFNLDWFYTYLKDSGFLQLETFYFENVYFKHLNDNILFWNNNSLHYCYQDLSVRENSSTKIDIANDCIKFLPNISKEECYKEATEVLLV